MTTEQAQNIAIAQFCGVTPLAENEGVRRVWIETFGEDLGPWGFVKNYSSDLNAINEAWRKLDRNGRIAFSNHLRYVVVNDGINGFDNDIVCACENASATLRARALVRMIAEAHDHP